jgi:hypothetical protein
MDWWHTANLLAQQANQNRPPHTPTKDPRQYNPFAPKAKPRQATPEEIEKLLGPKWHEVDTR